MSWTICDVYWTAGFIEGDGSIVLNGKSPRIQAIQAEYAPLQKLLDLWGGTICPKRRNIGTKLLHAWVVGGEVAVGLMMMMYDLMSPPRKEQIQLVLGQWKKNGARAGAKHHGVKLDDVQALEAMRRVLSGESMTSVAEAVGISRSSLSLWFSETKRPDLMRRLRGQPALVQWRDATTTSPVFIRAPQARNAILRELHWTAGFLEAEGHIAGLKKDIRLQGTQCELSPLKKLQALWGGHIYTRKRGVNKPVSDWHLNGADAAALMMTLYPLMSPSRRCAIGKQLSEWRLRKVQHGPTHHCATLSDTEALAAMRHVWQGRSLELVAEHCGITRHSLSLWLRGKNRPYLLKQLEEEGLQCQWQYNGGRRMRITLSDEIALEGMRRVQRGESINSVARSLDVQHVVVLQWMQGKNRPSLLKRLQEEQRQEEMVYG